MDQQKAIAHAQAPGIELTDDLLVCTSLAQLNLSTRIQNPEGTVVRGCMMEADGQKVVIIRQGQFSDGGKTVLLHTEDGHTVWTLWDWLQQARQIR